MEMVEANVEIKIGLNLKVSNFNIENVNIMLMTNERVEGMAVASLKDANLSD